MERGSPLDGVSGGVLGNIFETLVLSTSILEHCGTKWTTKRVPHGRFSKIYYLKKIKN